LKRDLIRPQLTGIQSGSEAKDLDLMDLLTQLLARKWLILFVTFLGAAVGAGLGQLPPNQFRASALVQIENRQAGIALPSELIGELLLGGERSGAFAADIHVINSRLILDPAAEALRLDLQALPVTAPVIGELLMRRPLPILADLLSDQFARMNERLRLAELVLPQGMPAGPITAEVLTGGRMRLTLTDGRSVEGAVPGRIELPDGGLVEITAVQSPPGREFLLRHRSLREAAAYIREGLSVRERGTTGIVDFAFTGTARDDNVGIVNAVIASYQEQNLRRRAAEIDQTIAFIERQLPEVQATMASATEELRVFRRDRQILELSRTTQDVLSRMVQIETRLEEFNFRKEQMLQRVTENHPDYRALLAEEENLRIRLEGLRADLGNVPETERELAQLTAQLERARLLDIQLAGRIEQLRVLRASAVSNIRVLERAETAPHVGPDRRRPIVLGGAGGLVLAILTVLGLNFMRRGIEDGRAIEELGLSLFASIEKVPALIGTKASDVRYGLALDEPRSAAAEALRGLRTGLRFSLAAAGAKSLMITSCAPADGKSFISLNLALVSGQAGARVLLIDADMRRGFLRQYFGLSRRVPGLSDLLAGGGDLDAVIHRHEASGIDFIPTGDFPPNPAELLAGPLLEQLLAHLSEYYDLIILDAPPALAVTDPGIIGQHAGMSLLVVRHMVTTATEVQEAIKSLAGAGVAMSGVILNQFDQRASRYGAYAARYGYYHGGYRYAYTSASRP